MKGVEFSGRFQFWAVVTMLTCIAVLGVSAVYAFLTQDIELPAAVPPGQSLLTSVFVSLAIAPWAFIGFDTVPQMAGEVGFASRKVVGLMVTTITVSSRVADYRGSALPPAESLTDLLGPIAMVLVVVAVSAGVLTGFIAASSRVLSTMGEAKMIPRAFRSLSRASGTPVFSILVIATLCSSTPWFGRAALSWLADMTSTGITIPYFFASIFEISLASVGPRSAEAMAPSAGLKVLGMAGTLIAVLFLSLLLVPSSPGALGTESLFALIVWAVLGGALLGLSWPRFKTTGIDALHQEYTEAEQQGQAPM
ncbi:APC family permease [Micrococcus luteus]|uniref:APC family permease n=1 Tax=Micrococcus luteus TaxID=1270 RepID=UPI0021053E06|nr:APC family permease [Micrococcus luteus]UTX34071.1 APC family permease [Micrococcus luteus]